MTSKLNVYVAVIIMLGVMFCISTLGLVEIIDIRGVLFFIVLSIIAESLLILTPEDQALSVGFPISLAAVLIFGVPEAAWIGCLGVMLRVINKDGKRYHILNCPFYKVLFNGANIALSTGLSGLLYEKLGGTPGQINLNNLILPILACLICFIAINTITMSLLLAFSSKESFINIWSKNIMWVIKEYFALAPLGIFMAIAYSNSGILGAVMFFGPLLLARYSFKLYVDMKRIYLDTVKSLSAAIEAKDPYTKGHSMRVSQYACSLAEKVGLPQKQMETLKIAAMLHDIGKIGIDESILNKPERLTEDEYEKIKQHPEIGVKIIQEINFLKEASIIIQNHHERIDGTGYPQGIKGKDINIEAAILSIADVFDALTSERPYRSSLSLAEAIEVLNNGRGTQFDSKLVDIFIKMINNGEEMMRAC